MLSIRSFRRFILSNQALTHLPAAFMSWVCLASLMLKMRGAVGPTYGETELAQTRPRFLTTIPTYELRVLNPTRTVGVQLKG
ncbi:hypothetical protein GGS20DRAFT_568374 [Poronia punctata]|nr:hypothetical protein GGS20DRAFT_568374 [Poronia punctata]